MRKEIINSRQRQLLSLSAHGLDRPEIARVLGLSVAGIDHISLQTQQRFGLETLEAAVVRAFDLELLDIDNYVSDQDLALVPAVLAFEGIRQVWQERYNQRNVQHYNQQVARELVLSVKTVEAHVVRMHHLLGIPGRSRREFVLFYAAQQRKLV